MAKVEVKFDRINSIYKPGVREVFSDLSFRIL